MDKDYFDGNIKNQCYSTGFLWVQKMGKSPGLPTVILKVSSKPLYFDCDPECETKRHCFNSGPEGECERHCISITLEIQNPKMLVNNISVKFSILLAPETNLNYNRLYIIRILYYISIKTIWQVILQFMEEFLIYIVGKKKGKVHPCTGTEALYRPYGP
jgi:hypothetical protein